MDIVEKINSIYSVDITKAPTRGFVFLNGHKSEFVNKRLINSERFIIFSKDRDNYSYISYVDFKTSNIFIAINRNHNCSNLSAKDFLNNNVDEGGDFKLNIKNINSLDDILDSISNFKNKNSIKVFEKYCFFNVDNPNWTYGEIKFSIFYNEIKNKASHKVRSKNSNPHYDEYLFERGKVIIYFVPGNQEAGTKYMIHVNYDNNWYVIKSGSTPVAKMYSFSNRDDSNNPFQFKYGDEIKSFDNNDTILLFEEESFNRIMKKVDLESIFG